MKTLVLTDIHHRIDVASRILERESYDRAIFTGDFFDARGELDTPWHAAKTAKWLVKSLANPKHVHLWGNHDLSYGFDNAQAQCSGFEYTKYIAINEIVKREHWDKLKFFYIHQGWLLTHAGLHPNWLPPVWKEKDATLGNIRTFLDVETRKCLTQLKSGYGIHWFYVAGDGRRKFPIGIEAGGLVWCDYTREFQPINTIAQIFGHTFRPEYPSIVRGDTGLDMISSSEVLKKSISPKDKWNVDLDCASRFYGVIEDGILTLKES